MNIPVALCLLGLALTGYGLWGLRKFKTPGITGIAVVMFLLGINLFFHYLYETIQWLKGL